VKALKHMVLTPMNKKEIELQCKLVSEAASGDPGEENETDVLKAHSQKIKQTEQKTANEELENILVQTKMAMRSIETMAKFAEEKIEVMEGRIKNLMDEITSYKQL